MPINLTYYKKIDELIIKGLGNGPLKTVDLLAYVHRHKKPLTKQGFYAALRKLKKEEVVVIYGNKTGLNTTWIHDTRYLFEEMSKAYEIERTSFEALRLKDGENLSYVFSTLKHLDVFWGHVQNIFLQNTPVDEAIYSFDPHYWLYLARQNSERKILAHIIRNGRKFLMTVGSNTPLDKIIKKDFTSRYLQYNCKKIFPKEDFYISVIGDYIIEISMDKKIAASIDAIYTTNNSLTSEVQALFEDIVERKSKSRIKISRNKAKATRLKKKLSKDFY